MSTFRVFTVAIDEAGLSGAGAGIEGFIDHRTTMVMADLGSVTLPATVTDAQAINRARGNARWRDLIDELNRTFNTVEIVNIVYDDTGSEDPTVSPTTLTFDMLVGGDEKVRINNDENDPASQDFIGEAPIGVTHVVDSTTAATNTAISAIERAVARVLLHGDTKLMERYDPTLNVAGSVAFPIKWESVTYQALAGDLTEGRAAATVTEVV